MGKKQQAQSILLHGLQRLEYRGYDSAGLVVGSDEGEMRHWKSVGKVASLTKKVNDSDNEKATFGIAHTRWATHGGVTELNCHPHVSNDGSFFIVHNGIIENYLKLKKELIAKGYTFYSETDTEVIANLLQDQWTGNLVETVQKVVGMLIGAYALLIVHTGTRNEMVGVRWGSPLLFGYNEKWSGGDGEVHCSLGTMIVAIFSFLLTVKHGVAI